MSAALKIINRRTQLQEGSIAAAQKTVDFHAISNHMFSSNRAAVVLEFQVVLLGNLGRQEIVPRAKRILARRQAKRVAADGEFDSRSGIENFRARNGVANFIGKAQELKTECVGKFSRGQIKTRKMILRVVAIDKRLVGVRDVGNTLLLMLYV